MKRWPAILIVTFIFLLGVLSGGLAIYGVNKSKFNKYLAGGQKTKSELIVKRISSKLNLDETQRRQIEEIMNDAQAEIKKVRSQIKPQIEGIITRSEEKIEKLLKAEQRKLFEEMKARRKSKNKELEKELGRRQD